MADEPVREESECFSARDGRNLQNVRERESDLMSSHWLLTFVVRPNVDRIIRISAHATATTSTSIPGAILTIALLPPLYTLAINSIFSSSNGRRLSGACSPMNKYMLSGSTTLPVATMVGNPLVDSITRRIVLNSVPQWALMLRTGAGSARSIILGPANTTNLEPDCGTASSLQSRGPPLGGSKYASQSKAQRTVVSIRAGGSCALESEYG
ncbi:hypothetical protein BCR44DRAFT_236207 [Catenaria anguillulae PL171]|uniref:Uncharacterized protein n=1 Tax=Catenaria anguillulae PL171 TaxID=765915 RepID=A0A1Y2HBH6_9FUNG|nr:hypothetical protein BCR44DRAFT_236207 [Catenaria anguillulae PL171]